MYFKKKYNFNIFLSIYVSGGGKVWNNQGFFY